MVICQINIEKALIISGKKLCALNLENNPVSNFWIHAFDLKIFG